MSLASLDTSALLESPAVRVWRNRRFALYMGGQAPYYVTHWMQRIAVGWLAWELTHSHAWVGAVAAAEMFPMIVVGPFAGALADRHDPLVQARWAQVLLSLEALLMALATLTGVVNIWIIIALSLVSGSIQPVSTASRQLVLPATIQREDFATAISLDSTLFHGSRFIGPAFAAFLIPIIGVGGTLVTHAAGTLFFGLALTRLKISPRDRGAARKASLVSDIVEGLRYASRHPVLLPLYLMMTVCALMARPLQELLPGFAGGVFNAGPSGLAWLTSSMGIGSMVAAAFLAVRGRAQGLPYVVILACFGLGVSTFGMVATSQLVYAVTFAALFGFTLTVMGVGIQAMGQIAVDDNMRGRVMILYVMIYRGLPAIGSLLVGLLAEWIGLRSAFAFSALACIVTWLVLAPRHHGIEAALKIRERAAA